MPEGSTKVGGQTKTVSLTDFIALKERTRKLEAQLADKNTRIGDLEAELKVASVDGDDGEAVNTVKQHLLKREREIKDLENSIKEKETNFSEREKLVRAKELALEYQERGLTVDVEDLKDQDDPEKYLLTKWGEHLAEENGKLKGGTKEETTPQGEVKTPEAAKTIAETPAKTPVYERGAVGVSKKMPKDMTDTEFAQYEESIKAKALSVK